MLPALWPAPPPELAVLVLLSLLGRPLPPLGVIPAAQPPFMGAAGFCGTALLEHCGLLLDAVDACSAGVFCGAGLTAS